MTEEKTEKEIPAQEVDKEKKEPVTEAPKEDKKEESPEPKQDAPPKTEKPKVAGAPEGSAKDQDSKKGKSRKKINKMTLEEIDKKIKETENKMAGLNSKYAQKLLERKKELTSAGDAEKTD